MSMLSEIRDTARLSIPLVIGYLSQVGMGFTDTVMAGRLGAIDLAAVAIGTTLWLPVYLVCFGVLMAVSPSVAQLYGARRLAAIGPLFRQGLWLALALAAFAVPTTRHIGQIMPWLNIDPAVVPITLDYLDAVAWGMPGACLFVLLRFVGEGSAYTRPFMYVQLFGLLANAIGNYAFMFGHFGAPAMGAVGAGWSTALVLWLNTLTMAAYVLGHRHFRPMHLNARWDAPRPRQLVALLRLGGPIAFSLLMEGGFFTAISLLMGSLGAITVAAHQIAVNFASVTFMFPLGIAMACTARVGQAVGGGRWFDARRAGFVAMGMSVALMALAAVCMLLFPSLIVSVYTREPAVTSLAVELLFMAAMFQIFDGLQASSAGALRGLKDTAVPMGLTALAYWGVGLPLSYTLGITQAWGPRGLWAGLVAGLALAALLLALRFHRQTRHMRTTPIAAVEDSSPVN